MNYVRSHNGPQYHSDEFAQFASDWGFRHTTSSPRYPQSNGQAERAVRTVKDILRKENDPAKALLAYRSTPFASGYSPAQLLMGRNIKSAYQLIQINLCRRSSIEEISRKREKQAENTRNESLTTAMKFKK